MSNNLHTESHIDDDSFGICLSSLSRLFVDIYKQGQSGGVASNHEKEQQRVTFEFAKEKDHVK